MTTLYVRDHSAFREAEPADVLDRAHALLAQRYRVGSPVLTSPALTREFLRVRLGACDHEVFGALHLDSRHRLIAVENLFRGTIANAAVYPREVVKSALAHNSAALVLFHNHPLCFVRGVNLEPEREFGLALSPLKLPRRRGRQGAARLTSESLRCSPEVASQACDGARCGVGRVLVGKPAHSRE
jgi:hypothetical protein